VKTRVPLVALAAVLALCACGRKGIDPALCGPADERVTASCHMPDGSCWDLWCKSMNDNGVCFTDEEQIRDRDGCEKTSRGTWSTTCPCKREGAIGGCKTAKEEGRAVTRWMYGGLTTEQYQNNCETSAYNTFFAP
jgi:hypothetical protein